MAGHRSHPSDEVRKGGEATGRKPVPPVMTKPVSVVRGLKPDSK